MDRRVRVFIDFWNFQLAWNDRTAKARIDWAKLPRVLVDRGQRSLLSAGLSDTLLLEETRVYASYDPQSAKDLKFRDWLSEFLDRQPGIRVFTRERRPLTKPLRCSNCEGLIGTCPHCSKPLRRTVEKGVDAAIVTDVLSLAWEGAYDVAVLLSSDTDLIPAVERVQEKGIKVINGAWRGRGDDLAKRCWASFHVDEVRLELTRIGSEIPTASGLTPPIT